MRQLKKRHDATNTAQIYNPTLFGCECLRFSVVQCTTISDSFRICYWHPCVLSFRMINFLPYAAILFLAVGIADLAFADEILKDFYGKGIGKTVTRAETKRNYEQAGRPLAPNAVKTGREIVIDKRGRRIGLAIPNIQGDTNNDLLRLRSGKRVGNQIFDSGGRRVGIIISK